MSYSRIFQRNMRRLSSNISVLNRFATLNVSKKIKPKGGDEKIPYGRIVSVLAGGAVLIAAGEYNSKKPIPIHSFPVVSLQPKVNPFYKLSDGKFFNQMNFRIAAEGKVSSYDNLEEGGSCYGLTAMWYAKYTMGQRLLADLDQILDSKLDPLQSNSGRNNATLKDIRVLQDNQHLKAQYYFSDSQMRINPRFHTKMYELKAMPNYDSQNPKKSLSELVDIVIKTSLSNPGIMIEAFPYGKHVIGVVSRQTGENEVMVSVFDANNGEWTSDPVKAKDLLLDYYKYYYTPDNQFFKVAKTNIERKYYGLFWKKYAEKTVSQERSDPLDNIRALAI